MERIDWSREDYHLGLFKLIVRVFRADKFPSVYIIVAVGRGGGGEGGRGRKRVLCGKGGRKAGGR